MLRWAYAFGLALTLAACGGGGGSGSPADAPPSSTISGYVVKGPANGAIVQLHSLGATGQSTLLAQTSSSQDGHYSFSAEPGVGTMLLLTASGGTYVDEATSQTRTLSTPVRALVIRASGSQRVSPNPYSELAVRVVEQSGSPWTTASIQAANTKVAQWLGVPHVLDFRPVALQQPNLDLTGVTEGDFGMSLAAGAFSTFSHRLDTNPASSLSAGLAALYHLLEVDPADDRLFPAFMGGLVDFVDLMGLTDQEKRDAKTALLIGGNTSLGSAELSRITPHGTSSGSATAPMPDDGFRLLGSPGGRTAFNKRGALVGFTSSVSTPDWQVLYTASVGELFGDGDVGIGRWNGGGILSSMNIGGTFEPTLTYLPYDALHYAVAREPVEVPICGLRRLTLTANTKPTLLSETVGAQQAFVDLTPDSRVSLQYLGGIYLGADIGVRLADGSVVRFRTPGGVDAPWASVQPIDAGAVSLVPVSPAGPLENKGMAVTVLVAGTGARKVAARVDINPMSDPTRATAVFIAAAGEPETPGCASVGAPGPGVSPRPSDGQHHVFLSFNGEDTFLGAPRDATFGAAGELQSVLSPFTLAGPTYELSGNADVSIGRVIATGLIAGNSVSRSTPYAVVRPGATLPPSGTIHYDLISATSVMADRGGSGSEVPPGTVTAATLSIAYGQYPLGTASPWYSTASLRVDGQIGGLLFSVGDPSSTSPAQARMVGEAFNENNIKGAVGTPDGEFAAVHYKAGVSGVPVSGTLLFRRRP
jgi:hypothetical protein